MSDEPPWSRAMVAREISGLEQTGISPRPEPGAPQESLASTIRTSTGPAALGHTRDVSLDEAVSALDATMVRGAESDAPALDRLGDASRYDLHDELGRGAQGVVLRATDRVLQREVALKLAHAQGSAIATEDLMSFLSEARTMARIAHPNIVPVYDAGVLRDGRPYYAMPVLPRRTFRDIIDERAAGTDDAEHTLVRLLRSFSSVCMAVEAAHQNGVIHRDLKPANLVSGPRGEILVADFGLARLVSAQHHTLGTAVGTPLYMSPEQARGAPDVGPPTDIYALGVILYEILTGGVPIQRSGFVEQLVAVLEDAPDPPIPKHAGLVVPPDLAELAMRCLAKSPSDRPASARALVDEVDAWLEGRRERERRQAEVGRLLDHAREALTESGRGIATIARERRDAIDQLAALPDHATIEKKAPLWRALEQVEARAREQRRAEDEAMVLLESALMLDPNSKAVRVEIAQMHLTRMARHEDQRDREGAAEEARRARRVDPETAARALDRPSTLVVSLVGTSRCAIDLYEEQDRTLVPTVLREGIASGARLELAPGSYRLRATSTAGTTEVVLPFAVHRGAELSLELDVEPADRAPPGFIYIPPGPSLLGGDTESAYAEPERERRVLGFFIMRDPVSCGEYAAFLDSLAGMHGDGVLRRAPRVSNNGPAYWGFENGHVSYPAQDEQGDPWGPDYPVMSVSAFDAEAFGAWRGLMEDARFRLPTDEEWERAGRGADGRIYPWGHAFDPAFCKMRLSRAGDTRPEPIGSFASDLSPFGVRDMAGGVADWTASAYRSDPMMRSVRGGGWSTRAHRCALTFRGFANADTPSADLGFRLVADLR